MLNFMQFKGLAEGAGACSSMAPWLILFFNGVYNLQSVLATSALYRRPQINHQVNLWIDNNKLYTQIDNIHGILHETDKDNLCQS